MSIYEEEVVVLIDEDGEEAEFEVIDVFECNGKDYAVLYPANDEETDEALIMRIEKDEEDDEILVDIEEDDEWDKVVAEYERLLEEEEAEFEDEDDDEQ